jgi:hypothetical protein
MDPVEWLILIKNLKLNDFEFIVILVVNAIYKTNKTI